MYEIHRRSALRVDTRVINSRTCRHDESIKELFFFILTAVDTFRLTSREMEARGQLMVSLSATA